MKNTPTEFGNVLLNADISPNFTKNMKGFLLLILSQMKRRMSLFSATTCCNVRNPCHMSNLRNSTGWEGVPGGSGYRVGVGIGWEGYRVGGWGTHEYSSRNSGHCTAVHGREIVLETFSKTNMLNHQNGEIKKEGPPVPFWRKNKALQALGSLILRLRDPQGLAGLISSPIRHWRAFLLNYYFRYGHSEHSCLGINRSGKRHENSNNVIS